MHEANRSTWEKIMKIVTMTVNPVSGVGSRARLAMMAAGRASSHPGNVYTGSSRTHKKNRRKALQMSARRKARR